MKRQGQYNEADINSMVAAQLQHFQTQQRIQQYPDNSYPGRYPGQAPGEHQYVASKARQSQWDQDGAKRQSQWDQDGSKRQSQWDQDGAKRQSQWDQDGAKRQSQWDQDGAKALNRLSPYAYNEGQGAQGAPSFYDSQRSDLKFGVEKHASKDPRDEPPTDSIEARYEDNTLPQTFEGMEMNFHEDIVKLSKEQQDAEDAENARHRERLSEINAQYQEKLLALRARQATYREEFLRKESLARQQQYQQASLSNYANNIMPGEAHGYPPPPAAALPPPAAASSATGAYGEAHRGYAPGHYESFRERPEYGDRGQHRDFEHRGQYPGGRVYNSGGRRF